MKIRSSERRANGIDVAFKNSIRWPIYTKTLVNETKLSYNASTDETQKFL